MNPNYYDKYVKYKTKYNNLIMQSNINSSNIQNPNICKCNYYQVTIGRFEQISDKMIVSDPSYEYVPEEHEPNSCLMKLNIVVDNVLSGQWVMILLIKKDIKDSNAELLCIHNSVTDSHSSILQIPWRKIGGIGVDTGQAGIYDLRNYHNNLRYDNEWYEMNSNLTNKPTDYSGVIPYGAVSSSGFGDGMYPVYVATNENSKIVAVKIVFID